MLLDLDLTGVAWFSVGYACWAKVLQRAVLLVLSGAHDTAVSALVRLTWSRAEGVSPPLLAMSLGDRASFPEAP